MLMPDYQEIKKQTNRETLDFLMKKYKIESPKELSEIINDKNSDYEKRLELVDDGKDFNAKLYEKKN